MTQVKIGHGGWVVVCDGAKALLFENIGDAEYPDLRTREAETQPAPLTSELGAERPGRVHQSVGPGRSSVEQTDFHQLAEEDFLRDLAGRLDRAVLAKETDKIVLVAPPRALGVLRRHAGQHLKGALVAEIDKDLTGMPVPDIETHLFGRRR